MSKRYSGKSFKDSSVMKQSKLSLKEKRKRKKEKKRNKQGRSDSFSILINNTISVI